MLASLSTWIKDALPVGLSELPLAVVVVVGGAVIAVLLGLILLAIATAKSENAGIRNERVRQENIVFSGPAPVTGSWGALTNITPGWVPPPIGSSAGSRPTNTRPL
ncbi:unannotated protein [freshwater metagenome]|uniref:Unannotated protein n=1 Tax=freshwater metagenome TaxID=449393 RepID=A0A6J7HD53_9ZZZZ